MKIAVFGGTGNTGKNVITRALAAGHEVVAIARKPEAITVTHEKLRVVKGDILDKGSLQTALEGVEAVISTVGPPSLLKPGKLLSEGTPNMLDACTAAGVRRFVFESGVIATDASEFSAMTRTFLKVGQTILGALYAEKVASEASVQASALEWTIVRPPNLDHSPATGTYRVGKGLAIRLTKALSHDDVADYLVKAVDDAEHVRQIVNIGH